MWLLPNRKYISLRLLDMQSSYSSDMYSDECI